MDLIAQLLGYAGVLANLVWPTMRSRERLLAGQVVACVLMLSHFALLNAPTGALVMATAGVQAALAIPMGRRPGFRKIYLASLLATPVVCVVTWHGVASIFSSLALAIVSVANFQTRILVQRTVLITAIFAWMAHNVLVQSLPALTSNGLALLVSGYALHRTWADARRQQLARPATQSGH